jgi:hypothetical protein
MCHTAACICMSSIPGTFALLNLRCDLWTLEPVALQRTTLRTLHLAWSRAVAHELVYALEDGSLHLLRSSVEPAGNTANPSWPKAQARTVSQWGQLMLVALHANHGTITLHILQAKGAVHCLAVPLHPASWPIGAALGQQKAPCSRICTAPKAAAAGRRSQPAALQHRCTGPACTIGRGFAHQDGPQLLCGVGYSRSGQLQFSKVMPARSLLECHERCHAGAGGYASDERCICSNSCILHEHLCGACRLDLSRVLPTCWLP